MSIPARCRSARGKKIVLGVSLLVALSISVYLLCQPDPKFIAIALVWMATSVLSFGLCKGNVAKLLWLNFGFLCLFAGAAELYLRSQGYGTFGRPPISKEGTKDTLRHSHDILGYTLPSNVAVTDRQYSGQELMWDVTYTMDQRGLRITPEPQHLARCILFFGGSFTFGEGIDDNMTLPYQVGEKLAESTKTFNFGMTGYGAHQMLAALELGLVDEVVDCEPTAIREVVYQAIPTHPMRAAGIAPWDDHGPRYELDEKGEVVYRGHFDDGYRKHLRPLWKKAQKSSIYRRVFGKFQYLRRPNATDIDRYIAIVERTQELVRSRYPCAAVHIVYWDTDWQFSERVLSAFAARGLETHLVTKILPGYGVDGAGDIYRVHPDDSHPNGLANAGLADYLVETVFSQEATCEQSPAL